MKCPYCNKVVPDNLKYCPECGQTLTHSEETGGKTAEFWNDVDAQNNRINEYNKKLENEIQEVKRQKTQKYVGIMVALFAIAAIAAYMLIIRPSMQYSKALSLMDDGNYKQALEILETLNSYKTSEQEIERCNAALTKEKYDNAVKLFNSGDINTAIVEFHDLGDYSDSRHYYNICEMEALCQAEEQDIVTYGRYQGEDISWILLKKTSTEALLIAESYISNEYFDANRYHDDYADRWVYHFWSTSSLREWLNEDFLKSFSTDEIDRICETQLLTDEFETENYNGWGEEKITVTTIDRVYIPTIEDVYKYNLYTKSVEGKRGWLRDRGHGIAFEYSIDENGEIDSYWSDRECWIRPMMSVSLEGFEPIITEKESDCYNEETPFTGRYWVVYRNGHHDERIEATSVDSTHDPSMLHAVLKNYELNLNEDDGADNWTGYILTNSNQWENDGYAWPLADKTKTIIASNLDIYDEEGKLILPKMKYSDINWSKIE